MEENKEMKNGMITEEALEQIAGGLNVNPKVLNAVFAAAGVAVGIGGGIGIKALYDKYKKKKLDKEFEKLDLLNEVNEEKKEDF